MRTGIAEGNVNMDGLFRQNEYGSTRVRVLEMMG
jgi:hypothetical protein